MDYDVLILGGGIIGCAVAYELSKYNINIALIEKGYDVANDISFANTAVVYDGSESSSSKMALLEKRGIDIIRKHCKKFNVRYNKIGSLRIFLDESNELLNKVYSDSVDHGIDGVRIIDSNELYNVEPSLNLEANKAIYSENTSIISPYNLAVSYAEIAVDNGVNFRLEEEVIDIKTISKGFRVTTNKNKFTCKLVINTIPNESFNDMCSNVTSEMKNKKVRCIIVKKSIGDNLKKIIIEDIDEENSMIKVPISENENLIGIKISDNFSSKLELPERILKNIKKESIINIFTEVYSENDMLIDDSNLEVGYIKVVGNHYAKISVAPAIAQDIEKKVKVSMNITKKKDYIDKKRETYIFREMTKDQINRIISLDKRYGNIICNCNNISEGEIIDSIRRPLGARTVEGVKRRTGIGLGNCNGSNCNIKIIKILAREMDKSALDIVDDSMDSQILVGRIKEFNEI
ncbi:FAD-dependent oxidoreductase [Clostridium beijerinckii]|uniref:NAD(P)/FAD-dependent oxidoreductase n=1 Tax=Clostridium beijerinckii TaxID=1520 RepID=UPI00156ECC4D|nr:FAD-dependent oxidoreductase [Clostridium beijerinckii]NRT32228.1 L-2-hydroxyglutarate oxidase LhgO [Clostridium beijerinckii]NRT48344.1 L-2-hydroxyglutarate oxidase LhgO [Clostridium beijerinckii]NRZ23359.1 L-2-hydroxyglutarate oxidase LhgO [Clostridium beijerinckii]UYZ35073.1 FAD-dependent oxidoreductase [Clostridium beijerinckii]